AGTAPATEHDPGVYERRVAGCGRDRIRLVDERRGCRELPGEQMYTREVGQGDGKHRQCAGLPRESHHARGELLVSIIVPELEHGQRHDDWRQGEPAHALFMAFVRLVPERVEREPEACHTRGRALCEPACHAVEKEVDRAWW